MGLHRAQRQPGELGDLPVVHALVVRQHDAQAHVAGQRGERAVEIHGEAGHVVAGRRQRVVLRGVPQRIVPAQVLQPGINGDALQPRTESARLLQLSDVLPGLQERLLGEVIGQRQVAGTAAHQGAHPALSSLHELGEREPIAAARETHEQRLGAAGVLFPRESQD